MWIATAVLLVFVAGLQAQGQHPAEKPEIAVFRLSYHGQPEATPSEGIRAEIPGGRTSSVVERRGTGDKQHDALFARAFGLVDERIRGVFMGLGWFTVVRMDQRLTPEALDDLAALLRELPLAGGGLPEIVTLGSETFTEAEFRRLSGGSIAVVPSVPWYDLRRLEGGEYRAELEATFTFLDVQQMSPLAHLSAATFAEARRPEEAVREAVDRIPVDLASLVSGLPGFGILPRVTEVDGSLVVIEPGRYTPLERGDEYAVVAERVVQPGTIAASQTGLLVIREVAEQHAVAQVLYASPGVRVGDRLQKVPRRGFELQPYYEVMTDGLRSLTAFLGLRAAASRGYFDWRPFAVAEVPIRGFLVSGFVPLNLGVGAEWNLHVGRIRLTPSMAVGAGAAARVAGSPELPRLYLSHVGGTLKITGSLLVTRDLLVNVHTGVGLWAPTVSNPVFSALERYGGLIVGGGITVK